MKTRDCILLASLLVSAGCAAEPPSWISALGYGANEVFPIQLGRAGMPFVEVTVGTTTRPWLFDTGNMVGLTLATNEIDELHLREIARWERLDSDGQVIGTYRRVRAPAVRLLGRTLADHEIFEFSDADLVGLVGPDTLPGTRFTLDYRAGLIAVATSALETVPAGFFELPLTRSPRHPRLILATGHVDGRPVLVEFDTGASRTNIDPQLARELALPVVESGVRIDSLKIGPLAFAVPSAKVVPKSGIDRTLAQPILLAVGSDIIGQMILTVDYARGRLLVRDARAG